MANDPSYDELVNLKNSIHQQFGDDFKVTVVRVRPNMFNTRDGYELVIKPKRKTVKVYLDSALASLSKKRGTRPVIDGKLAALEPLIKKLK